MLGLEFKLEGTNNVTPLAENSWLHTVVALPPADTPLIVKSFVSNLTVVGFTNDRSETEKIHT